MEPKCGILTRKPALVPQELNADSHLILGTCVDSDIAPQITIAIPTYQRPELLLQALQSALGQRTTRKYEIIVIDNDDSNEYRERVDACVGGFRSPKVSLYRNRFNVGMFGNWNRCLTLARAHWVTILNDDDLLGQDFIECVCDLIDHCSDANLVQTGYEVFDLRRDDEKQMSGRWDGIDFDRESIVRPISFRHLCLANTRVGSLAIAYRRELALDLGGFQAEEYPTADYFFNARLLANAAGGFEVMTPLATYRISDNESLKPQVLSGFVINDYRLRIEAARHFSSSVAMKIYARFTANIHVKSLEEKWRVSLSLGLINESLGFFPWRSKFAIFLSRCISTGLRQLLMM